MSTTVQTATDIRPFHVDVSDEELTELRRRIDATRAAHFVRSASSAT